MGAARRAGGFGSSSDDGRALETFVSETRSILVPAPAYPPRELPASAPSPVSSPVASVEPQPRRPPAALVIFVETGVLAFVASSVRAAAWNLRAVLAPAAIGLVVLAGGAAMASTVFVMARRTAPPARQAAVAVPQNASAASPPVRAALPAAVPVTAPVETAVTAAAVAQQDVEAEPIIEPQPAVTADAVRAIWLKTDTRSLDRALSAVRQVTLAFRRCQVQVTATDQAVAQCDLAPAGGKGRAWTIDFSRADERWQIDGITEKPS